MIPDDDPTGNPTVGYGHLCDAPQCSEVKYPIPLSVVNGKKLLADDMKVRSHYSYQGASLLTKSASIGVRSLYHSHAEQQGKAQQEPVWRAHKLGFQHGLRQCWIVYPCWASE
jgi:hypothetical protein